MLNTILDILQQYDTAPAAAPATAPASTPDTPPFRTWNQQRETSIEEEEEDGDGYYDAQQSPSFANQPRESSIDGEKDADGYYGDGFDGAQQLENGEND